MSEEIIKVLDNLGEKFGIAIDWSSQNVLPYLQDLMSRFITYKNCSAIIGIVVSAMFIILSIILGVIICKKLKSYYESQQYRCKSDENFSYGLIWFCAGLIILIFAIVLFCNINGIFKNIYIPEATIIEYINSLANIGG